jgi:hypothetical protein
MKRFLIIAAAALFSGTSFAQIERSMGLDVFHSYLDYESSTLRRVDGVVNLDQRMVIKRKVQRNPKFNLYHSWVIHKFFGLETGAFISEQFNPKNHMPQVRKKGAYASAQIHLPVTAMTSAFFGGGVGLLNVHFHDNAQRLGFNGYKVTPRASGGLQLKVSEDFALRASAVWYSLDSFKNEQFKINNNIHLGVGLNYAFN